MAVPASAPASPRSKPAWMSARRRSRRRGNLSLSRPPKRSPAMCWWSGLVPPACRRPAASLWAAPTWSWRASACTSAGQRSGLAGSGPLCLQPAAELLDGGTNVVAVLEAASRPGFARWRDLLAAASAAPGLLLEGMALANRLRGLLHWDRKVTRLLGEGRVQRVEAGDLSIDADIVALGYGFASSSELARALGCAHRFVPRGSGSLEP